MRNKEQTKRKLIQAVGEIIKTEGFSNLKISKIAKKAEVNRKLVYRYFGTLDYLIETYVVENDYWMVFSNQMKEMLRQHNYGSSQELITSILQNQFKFFMSQKEMQRLILWELSVNSPLMRSIHNARESLGQNFLELADEHFGNSKVNFKAVAALLVGGIYYTVLHTTYNGSTFTGLDINSQAGNDEILKAIGQIVGWAYQEGEK